MSKQSEAKEKQGYTRNQFTCANCKHFTCDVEENSWGGFVERNLRCSIGGFKVHKTARCNEHVLVSE